jgi:hypothetical protein
MVCFLFVFYSALKTVGRVHPKIAVLGTFFAVLLKPNMNVLKTNLKHETYWIWKT